MTGQRAGEPASFQFDASKSFDENVAAYLDVLEVIDAQMAAILRENAALLAAIVRDGERDPSARGEFNSLIAAALDSLATSNAEGEGA